MSPKLGLPCATLLVPNASPSSETSPMLMFALTAQVWKARRTSRSQEAVSGPSSEERELGEPLMFVPSGAKLNVRVVGLIQGTPQVGVSRSSRCSTDNRAGEAGVTGGSLKV